MLDTFAVKRYGKNRRGAIPKTRIYSGASRANISYGEKTILGTRSITAAYARIRFKLVHRDTGGARWPPCSRRARGGPLTS